MFPIDFVGQRTTHKIVNGALFVGSIAACLVGFFTQSVGNLLYCFLAAYFTCLLAVLPSYSKYNKNRPEWVHPKIGN